MDGGSWMTRKIIQYGYPLVQQVYSGYGETPDSHYWDMRRPVYKG